MANDRRNTGYRSSPPNTWTLNAHIYPHSHHGTPAHEYSGFSFGSPHAPMASATFDNHMSQRPMPMPLQPLVMPMPQYPSMLNSQAHPSYQPALYQPMQANHQMPVQSLPTPVSATSSRSASTPRRTLTDLDRKRMCQYAEENPDAKQLEIGAVFGVERSTVSKVLRQKDKFLLQKEEGNQSPARRPKGRSPDIERALSNWAKNQVRKGLPLTDEILRDTARAFSSTSSSPDSHATLSSSWIERFKLKYDLMGARSRKQSLAPEVTEVRTTTRDALGSPDDVGSPSPTRLHGMQSGESLQTDSPDSYLDYTTRGGPIHSESHTSLNSAFVETASTSFSPVTMSPNSTFYVTSSGPMSSPFIAPAPYQTLSSSEVAPTVHSHRPGSQTFPLIGQYMAAEMANSAELPTPKYTSAFLDSPMGEVADPLPHLNSSMDRIPIENSTNMMRPPPLPSSVTPKSTTSVPSGQGSVPTSPTSPEEARRALEVVLGFFQQQPSGYLDFDESVTMGRLMEKLKLQAQGG